MAMSVSQEEQRVAFDEFKLFYESAEKVTDRRLAANRWNYSICIAILGAIAAITNWGIAQPSFLVAAIAGVVILAGMASLYCTLWVGQIRDLKELNNAKFTVINDMAPLISFSEANDDERISFRPFEKEWETLKKAQVAQEIRSINIIALKSSNIEYLIPKAFRILFILIIIIFPLEVWRYYKALSTTTNFASPPAITQPQTQQK